MKFIVIINFSKLYKKKQQQHTYKLDLAGNIGKDSDGLMANLLAYSRIPNKTHFVSKINICKMQINIIFISTIHSRDCSYVRKNQCRSKINMGF